MFFFHLYSLKNFLLLVNVDNILAKVPHTCLRSKNEWQIRNRRAQKLPTSGFRVLPISEFYRFFTEKFADLLNWNSAGLGFGLGLGLGLGLGFGFGFGFGFSFGLGLGFGFGFGLGLG